MIKHIITNHPNFEIKSFKEYQNDILMKEENYNHKGQPHGLYRTWYENGQLFEESTYKNGKEHGSIRLWHHNGQLAEEFHFKNSISRME
jgi:antitoxin component YwqK of YwqJK toxin-antitoxin module